MFDFGIGSTELIVLGVIALIVIGPRDLPKVLRTLGQVMTKVRGLAREFQGHIEEAAKDTGLDEIKKDISKATNFSATDILDDKPRTPGKVEKPAETKPAPDSKETAKPATGESKPAAKKKPAKADDGGKA
jgi:sec-independent protein translocase protein TatB